MDYNVDFYNHVLSNPQEIFTRLEEQIVYLPADETNVTVRGKVYPMPRQMVAFGDAGLSYAFSGLQVSTQPWTSLLLEIRQVVEKLSGSSYNFVLINRYKDGHDRIGHHRDNEKDLQPGYTIASLSLGQARTMTFHHVDHVGELRTQELTDNSLLVMKDPTNQHWKHGIDKQPNREGVRINLTFRRMSTLKRKAEEDALTETKKLNGTFTQDEVPEHLTALGDDFFIGPSLFREKVKVHLRRYRKYGKRYYPTSEGIVLPDVSIDSLVYATPQPIELEHFSLTVASDGQYEIAQIDNDKRVQLSVSQWEKMNNNADKIVCDTLDFVYRQKDFCEFYEFAADTTVKDQPTPQASIDFLNKLLKDKLIVYFKNKGGLKEPQYMDCEELWVNKVGTFNAIALRIELSYVARLFYEGAVSSRPFSFAPTQSFITKDFFKQLRLDELLRQVRDVFCPSNLTERGLHCIEFYESLDYTPVLHDEVF